MYNSNILLLSVTVFILIYVVKLFSTKSRFSFLSQIVSHNTSPEWNEGFTWAFDVPPRGQKLHILCRNKSTFGKVKVFTQYIMYPFLIALMKKKKKDFIKNEWLLIYFSNDCVGFLFFFFFQTTLGRVTIQIDKVVSEGTYSGEFSLSQDGNNKDNSSRTLDIEIIWSNRISDEAS